VKTETKKKILKCVNNATGGALLGGVFLGGGWIGATALVTYSAASLYFRRRTMREDERDFHKGVVTGGLSLLSPETLDRWLDKV
jgi:hypothetical protein